VSSNNKIVLSRFFEQSNFEQMIMTRYFQPLINVKPFLVIQRRIR
jgi:hypothetical protein